MADIKQMTQAAKEMCIAQGFGWEGNYSNMAERIARTHSEVSEVFDVIKKGLPYEQAFEEVADIFFYVLYFADQFGMDLEEEFYKKLEKNYCRPRNYGTFNQKLPFEEE